MDSVGALSNKGRRRRKNEDSILSVPLSGGAVLIAVADGVGGERAGEVASSGVTKLLSEQLTSQVLSHFDEDLAMAIQAANHTLWERARNDVRLQGMATTLVAAIVDDGNAWLANVGDSRAYLIEGANITQITQDHSLVAERVREGDLTEEEARQSQARHIITRSIASDAHIEVDTFGPLALPADSRLLLCSDGLHDVVEESEIARIASSVPADEAVRELIDAANNRGGPDNISVVIYQAPGAAGAAPPPRKRTSSVEPPNRYALAGITAGIILVIGAVALGAGLLVGESSDDDGAPAQNGAVASPTPLARLSEPPDDDEPVRAAGRSTASTAPGTEAAGSDVTPFVPPSLLGAAATATACVALEAAATPDAEGAEGTPGCPDTPTPRPE